MFSSVITSSDLVQIFDQGACCSVPTMRTRFPREVRRSPHAVGDPLQRDFERLGPRQFLRFRPAYLGSCPEALIPPSSRRGGGVCK